ncbi:unnamed protein product [Heterobilharzia americana]|nr:unnamed protein product [Heterobilharzia americana]
MFEIGRLTENPLVVGNSLKTENSQVNKSTRKFGLRDINIQQNAPVQQELKQGPKVLVPEEAFGDERENYIPPGDTDEYNYIHERLVNLNSLLDGVIFLSCKNSSVSTEYLIESDTHECDVSDIEIPDDEINAIFTHIG